MLKAIRIFTLFIAAFALSGGIASAADSYSLDQAHSSVGFSVKHLVVSNVYGYFNDFDVNLTFNPEDLSASSVQAAIQAASVNTRNADRDKHLKSPDFLNVEANPTIVFQSKKFEKHGDNLYHVTGDLTINGVTKEVVLPVNIVGPFAGPMGSTVLAVSGELKINRQDYDVKWSMALDNGGLVVSDEVTVMIDLEMTKE